MIQLMTKSFSGLSCGPRHIISALSGKYKRWKDARFLKKHGCSSWNEYNHIYDTDVFRSASRVTDYYMGYKYVHCFDNRDNYAYKLLYDYGPGGYRYGYHDIVDWCKENTKHKHRSDILRAMKEPCTANQWEINELGGGDYLFFAFQNEKEYTWFLLRWS